jgi:hypothetical protein
MTTSFENFLTQYKKTGIEKADGYSQDVFIGLDEAEKATVFDLLVGELTHSVEWLFFLDAEKALTVVKAEAERLRGDGYASGYRLLEELTRRTGDLSFQNQLIESFTGYYDRLKPLVVDAVGRTPASMAAISFFRRVILEDANQSAISRAANHLLYAVGIPRTTETEKQIYEQLLSDLRNDSRDVKLHALTQIEKHQ